MIDKIKLVLSALLLAAGIAGFYMLADKALVLRILAILAGLAAAIALRRQMLEEDKHKPKDAAVAPET